jgi:phosphate transport system permease protein
MTLAQRKAVNKLMIAITTVTAIAATLPLIFILYHLSLEGIRHFDLTFFTSTPKPVGEPGGGMANAIVGTMLLIGVASAIGMPVGIGAGVFLAERRGTKTASTIRFICDVMNGIPSIVLGIFAWETFVRPIGHFSALSGSLALAILMIPLVARTTEEVVHLVPRALREAALALGYTECRTAVSIVLRTALPGIMTGALLAVARISGETAPLLFTAFGNQFWSVSLKEPIAALPLQIFTYAISPYDEWHAQAWTGALVLITLVLVVSVISRFVIRNPVHASGR